LGAYTSAGTTGSGNVLAGYGANAVNFDGSIVLGRDAAATASNQFVVGSVVSPAGTIDTAVVTPTQRWRVKLNGTDYYIALQPV
jgi:hypothetical protein